MRRAIEFADRRAGAGPDVAFGHGGVRRGLRRGIPAVAAGPDPPITNPQIEKDRARDERDRRSAEANTDVSLLEVIHDPFLCVHAEGAAAGQDDPVNAFGTGERMEQRRLDRTRRPATDVHTRDRTTFGEDDGASSRTLGQRVVTDLESRDRGETFVRRRGSRVLRDTGKRQSHDRDDGGAFHAETPICNGRPAAYRATVSVTLSATAAMNCGWSDRKSVVEGQGDGHGG